MLKKIKRISNEVKCEKVSLEVENEPPHLVSKYLRLLQNVQLKSQGLKY